VAPIKNNSTSQVPKWPGSRIQRNVKLMPKRNDKVNNTINSNSEMTDRCSINIVPEKRRNSNSAEIVSSKKPRPEVSFIYYFVNYKEL
jgi:hypothetical protein